MSLISPTSSIRAFMAVERRVLLLSTFSFPLPRLPERSLNSLHQLPGASPPTPLPHSVSSLAWDSSTHAPASRCKSGGTHSQTPAPPATSRALSEPPVAPWRRLARSLALSARCFLLQYRGVMLDLFSDEIEDQARYPDELILKQVRALVDAGQREGSILDYKKDVSEKDNWPEAVAAFSNSFGGLLIFGVEGKGDEPHRVTGFDPKGVEIKAKITSMLLSPIQPRPEFQIRMVRQDQDPGKEVAVVRISEGSHPPDTYSVGHEHRIYVRIGTQKAEADYLQLAALFEKRRKVESRALVQTRGWRAMMKRCNGSSRSKICSKDGTSTDRSSFCA